jgi:hypothetical protein
MRIFLSYASEHANLAEQISLALTQQRHRVFFDRSTLQEGEAYRTRIQNELAKCQFVVFLVSREWLQAGRYTWTEFEEVRRRWSNPQGRVLPVLVDDTPVNALPPYLEALHVLRPKGDIATAVVRAVKPYTRRPIRVFVQLTAFLVLVSAVALALWFHLPRAETKKWCVTISPRMDGKHTQCFNTEAECRDYRRSAEASKRSNPLREFSECRLLSPLE